MTTPDAQSSLEREELPAAPEAANPFIIVNRISLWLLFGACVGFAVAIAGFIADVFWVAAIGSCITLVMATGWTLVASFALFSIGRDLWKALLIKAGRRAAKDEA